MLFIGICGASGSGKTTLAEELVRRVSGRVLMLHQDTYYINHPDMTFEARTRLNYDHPDAFDNELLYEDLKRLKEGLPVTEKNYDFTRHLRCDSGREIGPASVLIFEGIHAFYDPRVRDLLDLKLYIRVDPDICLLRRVERDMKERGRAIDDIAAQYRATVKPMYEKYIRGYEEYADIIVTRGGRGQRIADLLALYINQELSGPEREGEKI